MIGRIRTWWGFRRAVRAARQQAESAASEGDKDVVVIPCWRRPEFLWHCLDNLTRADGIERVHVLFRADRGYSPETLEVIDSFSERLASWKIEIADACPFRRTKPSANFLFGLLHACVTAKRLIYLVEEDIMVARDFFRWHQTVHRDAGPLFCSIPVKNPNRKLDLPEQVDAYYLSSGDSCSNGACYDKSALSQLIAPHVNMAYFRKPKRYLRRRFPDSKVALAFVEQDGLIRRVQEASRLPIAWPCVPRAFHAGFYGARGGWQHFRGSEGSLSERIKRVADTIYDETAVRAAIDRGEFLDSCMPSRMVLPAWSSLQRLNVPMPA